MRLGDLQNKHAGETVTIFGTGPSLDEFDLDELRGPRIFLNRTAFVLPVSVGETYWLVADDAWARGILGPWQAHLDAVRDGSAGTVGVFRDPLLNGRTPGKPPTGNNIVSWTCGHKPRAELRTFSRERVAEMGQLYQHCGTGAPAIHLAWLMGASRVVLVGIDGTDGWATRVQQFYDKPARGGFGYMASKADAIETAEVLAVEVDDRSETKAPL